MEELFKSLSESVSEGCFKDILDMVESILSEEDFNPFEYARKFSKYSKAKQNYENQKAKDEMFKGSTEERIQKNKAKSRNIKKKAKKNGEAPEFNPEYGAARREIPGENRDPKEIAYNKPRHSSDTSGEFPEYVLYREDD